MLSGARGLQLQGQGCSSNIRAAGQPSPWMEQHAAAAIATAAAGPVIKPAAAATEARAERSASGAVHVLAEAVSAMGASGVGAL